MASRKRQTKRKIVIRLAGRVPDDPYELFEAIEEAFRPRDIEITVEPESALVGYCPNEQLETTVKQTVSTALDTVNATAASSPADPKKAETVRQTTTKWVIGKLKSGWRIVATVTPVLDKLKNLFS